MKRALIAMSGGGDSSVAALELLRAGYDCVGATMRLYRSGDLGLPCHKSCCADSDAEDAEYVCYQLGIPHELLDFTGLFRVQVIQRFADEYERGRTPNPCIDCNRRLKFEALLDYALSRGFDVLATGHYARVCRDPARSASAPGRAIGRRSSRPRPFLFRGAVCGWTSTRRSAP